ncbi:MAG: prepilin-type N-terminal cleavage/methylation domain-containing protein [Verrucomicrobia bacterium]|nr:prepilin-type N-terminal cleavage/methylation domain-containing protein [Verrucomicrobiota bacterium]MCH8510764.1 prepilin-type N-terminal cleavage/methylation domain-containing protein [Kiritimatiellia bacterium]
MTGHSGHGQPNIGRQAFTLIEILLVILVIGIVVGAILPMAMDSVEGARLRAATREVVALNKYARSRAMLDRRPVAILYDRDLGVVELIQLPPLEMEMSAFLDTPSGRLLDDPDPHAEGTTTIRRRELPNFITVHAVDGLERVDQTWYAVYQSNGMTDPHSVTLRDNRGDTTRLKINGITGDVTLGTR